MGTKITPDGRNAFFIRDTSISEISPTTGQALAYDEIADKYIPTTFADGEGGEVNIGENIGTSGIGIYDHKQGVALQFKKLNSLSSRIEIIEDIPNQKIDFDLPENITFTSVDTDYIDFNLTSIVDVAEGRLRWDTDNGTGCIGLSGGNVCLQIGQELLIKVKCKQEGGILNGQIVYISGSTGNRPEIMLATAANYNTSFVLGAAIENIAFNQSGFVCMHGILSDINTDITGAVEGLPLWLDTTEGAFTCTQPDAPNMHVFIGYILRVSATQGRIAIRPTLVPRLQALSDVNGTPLTTSGQFLVWNNTTQVFDSDFNINDYLKYEDDSTISVIGLKAGSSTNYSKIETNGTLRMYGEATVFKDELQSLLIQLKNNPTDKLILNVAEGTLDFKDTATLTDYAIMNIQINHDWKIGSIIFPHIHWIQNQAQTPNWLIQYRWQSNDKLKDNTWKNYILSTNVFANPGTGEIKIQISNNNSGITPPVDAGLSDILQLRIIRDTNNDSTEFIGTDNYTGLASSINVDVHYEVNSIGSNEEYIK